MRIGLVVPTLNAGALWPRWLAALASQDLQPHRVLQIDSGSTDTTLALSQASAIPIESIPRHAFDHGGTRQWALNRLDDCDVVVFLTQDAILASPDALRQLTAPFVDSTIALAWGRQLPHADATPFAVLARAFNYPAQSRVVSLADRTRLGLKAAFASNSFAAWRRASLLAVGGFPSRTLFGEDTLCCARLLLADQRVAYVAEAAVFHSHNYTLGQEFRRYVDIGAFHTTESWLLEAFGTVEGEGLRQLRADLTALAPHGPLARAACVVRAGCKWCGYRLGRLAPRLPAAWMRRISMHPNWWR